MPDQRILWVIAIVVSLLSCHQDQHLDKVYPVNSNVTLSSLDTITDHKELSQLIALRQKGPKDTVLLKAIWRKSNLFDTGENYDSVLKYDRMLLQTATQRKNHFYTAKAQSYLAYDHRIKQKFDSAFYYYQSAKNSYTQINDSTQVGRMLLEIGKIQYRKNDYYGSKESITEALQFLDKARDKKYVIWCWNELGNNYASLEDFKNAKYNYEKAIAIEQDISNKILYINNLAILFSNNREYSKAITLLNDAIEKVPKDFKRTEYARLIHNKAECQWKQNKTNVLELYQEALSIRKKYQDKRGLLSSYRSLGEYYEKTRPTLAVNYLDSLVSLSKELNIPKAEIEALEILFRLQPFTISHKNRYIKLKDSLYLDELKSKNQFAYLKYQNQQEKERLLALESETAQNEAQLARQETQKILLLSISAILLMGGVSLYFLLKQRHKKEKLEEIYNTEKRISQELHDGLANDIFSLMTGIQGTHKDDDAVLTQLDHLYKTTRQISHDNAAIAVGEGFPEELWSLIYNYQHNGTTIVTKGLRETDWTRLNRHKCIALHRSVKELLVNMKKHSQATLVSLKFETQKNQFVLTYSDNGIGFHPNTEGGMGLANTENRIKAVGGTFIFEPKENKGMSATIAIPV